MNDSSVAADVDILADHNYDGANGPSYLPKNNYGKTLWETEVSTLSGSDGSMNNGIYWASRIYPVHDPGPSQCLPLLVA